MVACSNGLRMNESSFLGQIQTQMAQLSAQQLLRQRRVTQPLHGTNMRVDGQDMLTFCSNDYLGLATHPDLVRAAQHAATLYGVGSGGSPMVTGHSQANAQLELALAQWLQLPKALYFYAGFAANVGIIPALVGQGDAIFSDELNHACLIDGARLSKACIHRYAHLNLQDLSTALSQSQARRKLVITDAVFSMDGNSAPIANLLALCEQHDAVLLLDDAHGLGVLGSQGRGSLAQAGLCGEGASPRVLYMATLGKAAGVANM
jgi:8-amino-7-oxononanoate synthase